jgi:hypothetical protein
MVTRFFCDECGVECNIGRFWVHAEVAYGTLPEYHGELCSPRLEAKIAEYREFIDKLCKPRAKRPQADKNTRGFAKRATGS